jgi:hypothetical protein
MGLFDASSRSSSTDNRQTAGDASQQLHGKGNKVIQGGTDLSHSQVNTGTQIKGSKITTTNKINVTGADPSDLTLLASQAINQLGQSQSSNSSLLSALASAATSGNNTGSSSSSQPSGLSALAQGALADAGIGGTPSSSAGSGAGVTAWWGTLSTGGKLLVVGAGLLLLSGLIYFFKRL